MFPKALRIRRQKRGQHQQQRQLTLLFSVCIVLTVLVQNGATITAPTAAIQPTAATTATVNAATVNYHGSNYATAIAAAAASDYMQRQRYYHATTPAAAEAREARQAHSKATLASIYGHYINSQGGDVDGSSGADIGGANLGTTVITRDQMANLPLTTAAGFMPTTMTAAGRHFVAAKSRVATAPNDDRRTLYDAPAGQIDYSADEQGYERVAGGGSEDSGRSDDIFNTASLYNAADAAGSVGYGQFTEAAAAADNNDNRDTYFSGSHLTGYEHYFMPNYEGDAAQHDYDSYTQRDEQPQRSANNNELLQHLNERATRANYAHEKQQQQQQRNVHYYASQTDDGFALPQHPPAVTNAASKHVTHQQQLRSTHRTALLPHYIDSIADISRNAHIASNSGNNKEKRSSQHSSEAELDLHADSAHSESLYQYSHAHAQPASNALGHSTNDHHYAHYQPAPTTTSQASSNHPPPMPAITTSVHHTPLSAAAVAGVPLARHVAITNHIPTVTDYQRVHVPFNQSVPIEIPRPIITTIPRPFAIRVPVVSTVAVPKMQEVRIPMEKVKPFPVERPVPFLVERRVPFVVEKQVAKPVYYPYPIQVPMIKTIVHKASRHRYHGGPIVYQHHQLHDKHQLPLALGHYHHLAQHHTAVPVHYGHGMHYG